MKLTKLLVLGALMLSGTSAWAVDGNVWVKPAFPAIPEVSQFTTYEAVTAEADGDAKAVYLYNVATHLFYSSANNWGTHASIISADGSNNDVPTGECIRGSKVFFFSSADALAKGADVVEIKNWVYKFSEYRSAFGGNSGVGDCWTDNNGRDDRFWKVTDAGGNTYRISNVKNYTNFFLGWDPNAADTRLSLLDPAASEVGIDWKLVPAEAYETWYASVTEDMYQAILDWQTARTQYNAAMKLKEALDKAEAAGANVDDQIAIYNNPQSTADELTAAIPLVNAAIERAGYDNATAANPAVVTSLFITNPSYDGDKRTGWTWTPSGDGNLGMGYTAAEFYQKVFDINQTLSGMKAGVYAVDVQAFYRAGAGDGDAYKLYVANDPQSKDVKLYAISGGESMSMPITTPYPEATTEKVGRGNELAVKTTSGETIYIPQNMEAAEAYFNVDRYHNKLLFSTDGAEVTIGLKNSKSVSLNWVIFDNWSLTYYGNGADAYQAWWDSALKNYTATLGEDALYTESYLATLTAAITGKTATNKAEVLANIAAADAAQADLDENLNLWSQWKDAIAEGVSTINSYLMLEDDAIYNLMEYCDETYDERESLKILEAHNLDNEALTAEIAKVKALVAAVIEAAKNAVKEGDDMTQYLTNPDFAEGQKGWTGWKSVAQQKWGDGSLNMPVVNESCAEAFSAPNFDLYQEVEGLPLGIYEVSVQGFFRFGRGSDAWTAWNTQGEERSDYVKVDDPALGSPVFFYVNEKQTPFINVYQEDGRPGDSPLFDDLDTPANEGRTPLLRYGSDGKEITEWEDASEINSVENCQTVEAADGNKIFFPDGMKSAHNYFNADAYKQTTFSAVAHKGDKLRIGVKGHSDVGVSATNLDSWAIFDNFKLIYRGTSKEVVKPVLQDAIEVAKAKQKLSVAKDVKDELAAAIAAAEEAYNNDADNMFSVLANLWAVDVNSSLQKIQAIEAALPAFEEAVAAAEYLGDDERPLESVITEAKQVRGTAQDYIDGNVEFTNADLDEILQKMEELSKALKVPAGMHTATDDNFANATYLINNPTYDSNADGWTFTGDAGNKRQAEGVYEVWRTHADCGLYQDLTEMPEGTYELSVQGIYRFGYADSDYPSFIETPAENNNAWVYVTVGETETKSLLPRLSSIAEYYEAEAEVYGEETKYLPKNTNVTDNGDGTFKFDQHFQWGQMTVAEDAQSASGYILPDQLDVTTPFFDSGEVVNTSIIFKVGAEGKARIGINIKYVKDGDWTVWDNWKLTYYGKNSAKEVGPVNGIKDASSVTEIVKTEVFNLNGARVKTGKGIAIVRQTLSDGTVRVKKVMMK